MAWLTCISLIFSPKKKKKRKEVNKNEDAKVKDMQASLHQRNTIKSSMHRTKKKKKKAFFYLFAFFA